MILIGEPVFGDLGFFCRDGGNRLELTPLVADLDNDGWRDIIITNGFRGMTDHDFLVLPGIQPFTAKNLS